MGEEELWLQVRQAIKANMILDSRAEPGGKVGNDSNLKLENELNMTYIDIFRYILPADETGVLWVPCPTQYSHLICITYKK